MQSAEWAARWVETLARLQGTASSLTPRQREREAERIERRWKKLSETTEHANRCTLARAQLFIAREHGFASWPKFARHVQELARANSPISAFEAAADAIISGDAPTLRKLLAGHAGLARERSTREHRSTLLHYVSANGVEDFRQKTPKNIVEIANLLLDAGADVDAESDAIRRRMHNPRLSGDKIPSGAGRRANRSPPDIAGPGRDFSTAVRRRQQSFHREEEEEEEEEENRGHEGALLRVAGSMPRF